MRWLPLCLLLAGCMTTASNTPNPTATEQMLPAHAGERAAAGLNLRLPRGTKVFVDTTYVKGDEYLIAAIRAHLLGHGLALVDKALADAIVELRVSSFGIDDSTRTIGIPSLPVGSVHIGMPAVSTPALQLWQMHQRRGIAEFSAVAYDAHTGLLMKASGPIFAISRIVDHEILMGFVVGSQLERPGVQSQRDRF